MFKDSSARYYQDNKERLQKRLMKDIKISPKEKAKKNPTNLVMNNIKFYLKTKNKCWLSVESKYYKVRKNMSLLFVLCTE